VAGHRGFEGCSSDISRQDDCDTLGDHQTRWRRS
jgi:hypothetical protein